MTYCIDSIGCTGNVMTCSSCRAPDIPPGPLQCIRPHIAKNNAGLWYIVNYHERFIGVRIDLFDKAWFWVRAQNFPGEPVLIARMVGDV